jgi:hypothetical protein
MFMKFSAQGLQRKRIGSRVSTLFIFFAFLLVQIAMPVSAVETGIRGTVLWGPLRPGPERLGQVDEAPLSATFFVLAAEREIARFKSDRKGNFEVLLPPGDYTIVPEKSTPILGPQRKKKKVTVPADSIIEVTLRFDTGML